MTITDSECCSNTEDSFYKNGGVSVDQRKMNAVRAYFEWMPIRCVSQQESRVACTNTQYRQVDLDDNLRVWRSFQLGNLLVQTSDALSFVTILRHVTRIRTDRGTRRI